MTMPEQLVEFRSYALVPGGTTDFIEHFEAHFLASQEDMGMDILGQFRIIDEPDRFVWVRRFLEPLTRAASLQAFYTSPVWKQFGPRANELMVDVSDVHLLAPHPSGPQLAAGHVPHADRDRAPVEAASTVVAALYDVSDGLPPEVAAAMTAALDAAPDVTELGRLVTAGVVNDFPALPVHEDRTVALWLLSDREHGDRAVSVADLVGARCDLAPQLLRLVPTARSTLR
jgi:NIPSNAP